MDAFATAVAAVRGGAPPAEEAQRLYDALTEDERLGLLDGDTPFWPGLIAMMTEGYNVNPYVMGAVDRLGVPGLRFVDGPRGCVAGRGTAFPVAMARGATWDVDLEEAVGDVIGREIRAQGGNFFGGVCINLLRQPAWGRAQETYGDDPFHLGELGAALVPGVQRHVMACVKHFALNSMENARFTVDVTIDEATLHDVYLPHFRRATDEGALAVMGAYNSVNGEWAGQNPALLTEVFRDRWGWDGVTITDFIWGMRDGATALNAGMDVEAPFAQQRAAHLRDQLATGETTWDAVERSGRRVLAAQLRSYASRDRNTGGADVMANGEARVMARRVAARAMVLLKNDPVDGAPALPLDPDTVRSIAVIGRLATAPNLGDGGSSNVRAPSHVTPLDGLTAAFPTADITVVADDDPHAAAQAAAAADVAVIVVGYDARDEGEYVGADTMARPELLALFPPRPQPMVDAGLDLSSAVMSAGVGFGGDRESLALRALDEEIIRAVAAANPRTIVAIVAAGAVLTEAWRHQPPAIVLMWYAGMEGGHALADVLTGAQNPSGRLPFSIPTSSAHVPAFDRHATAVTYDRFHGQRLLDRLGVPAAFPHGFGLSYTTFSVADATIAAGADDHVVIDVTVTNTGAVAGRHVVQVYGHATTGAYAGERFLTGFAGIELAAGLSGVVRVVVQLTPLAVWDPASRRRVVPAAADVVLEVGSFAHDPDAVVVPIG